MRVGGLVPGRHASRCNPRSKRQRRSTTGPGDGPEPTAVQPAPMVQDTAVSCDPFEFTGDGVASAVHDAPFQDPLRVEPSVPGSQVLPTATQATAEVHDIPVGMLTSAVAKEP